MRLPSSPVAPVLRRALGALALTLAACAGEPTPMPPDAGTGPKFFDPANTLAPKGTLQGAVVDAYDQKPLSGAKVTINYEGASRTYTTGADGTFSFVDIPASANPNGDEAATGTYTVMLDLTGVSEEGRKYKPFRTQRVTVQFTQLTQPIAGGGGAGTTVSADRNPVSYLVSNVNFSVQQARAKVVGKVVSARDLSPVETQLRLEVAAPGGASLPVGATAAAVASAGATGVFSFDEIEEGINYRIVLGDESLVLDGTSLYQGGAFRAAELGAQTTVQTLVLVPRALQDVRAPYVVSVDPVENALLPKASANKSVSLTFNEQMAVNRPQQAVASFKRVGKRDKPDDAPSLQQTVAFVATWDAAGKALTIDPVQDLSPGYRYQLVLNNGELVDLASNARTGFIQDSSPLLRDAVANYAGQDDLLFTVAAEAAELSVTGLAQEPDTADNVSPGARVRAAVLERLPSATDDSFLSRLDSGNYSSEFGSHCAYVTWTAPAEPVSGYQVWVRKAENALPIALGGHPSSLNAAHRIPTGGLAGSRVAYDVCLDELSAVFAADPTVLAPLPNTWWDDELSLQVGISAINMDGKEGPIVWTTVNDNTAPIVVMDTKFIDLNQVNDSFTISGNSCSPNSVDRIMCPGVAMPAFANQVANGYGQRMVLFELSEEVDPATVIAANVKLTSGTLATNSVLPDPNTGGGADEGDATITAVVPYNVVNGRTKTIAIRFDNFFGIDTGDVFSIRASASAALKDLAGNAAKDDRFVDVPFVDRVGPQIKSVSYDAATESVTVVLTKRIKLEAPALSSIIGGNFRDNAFVPQTFDATAASLRSVTHSIAAGGESQVVLQYDDLGFIRGFNSTDGRCNGTPGTRFQLSGVKNADYVNAAGAQTADNSTDVGIEAYVNMPIDPAVPNTPGAYMPIGAAGLGTRTGLRDTIGPRLSNVFNDRTLLFNEYTAQAGTVSPADPLVETKTVDVKLTEEALLADATAAGNWTVTLVDLGNNGWTDNTGGEAAAKNVTVTVKSVAQQSNGGGSCTARPTYTITYELVNGDAQSKNLGVGQVTMGTSVKDLAGNSGGAKRTWTYSPTRTDANGLTVPGWVRN